MLLIASGKVRIGCAGIAGTGAAIAAEGERRRGGHYRYGCCVQRPADGARIPMDPRYC